MWLCDVQVNILWQKAVEDPGFKRIFCLAHAERLSYQVCDKIVYSLKDLSRGQQGMYMVHIACMHNSYLHIFLLQAEYRLVVICGSDRLREESRIISKLSVYKRRFNFKQHYSDESCQKYLRDHFLKYPVTSCSTPLKGSSVDLERYVHTQF